MSSAIKTYPLVVVACIGAGALAVSGNQVATITGLTAWVVVASMLLRREHAVLSPLGPLLLVVVTSGLLPAITVFSGEDHLLSLQKMDLIRSAWIFMCFVAAAMMIYVMFSSHRLPENNHSDEASTLSISVSSILFWASISLLAAFALWSMVSQSGGFAAYLEGLASRRVFFEEQEWGWRVVMLIAPAIVVLSIIASVGDALSRHAPKTKLLLLMMACVSLAFLFMTGNRMNMVVFAASSAVVVHRRVRRLSGRHILLGLAVVTLLSASLPTYLRPEGGGRRDFQFRFLSDSIEDIREHGPVSDFGHLLTIALISSGESAPDRQFGKTYLAGATILIPRAIAPWKLPGAGQLVTEAVFPNLWRQAGTGVQVTAPGEAFLNFGWPGVFLIGALFGWGLRLVKRLEMRSDAFGALLYAILLPRVALILRGEFANTLVFLGMELGVAGATYVVVRKRSVVHRKALQTAVA